MNQLEHKLLKKTPSHWDPRPSHIQHMWNNIHTTSSKYELHFEHIHTICSSLNQWSSFWKCQAYISNGYKTTAQQLFEKSLNTDLRRSAGVIYNTVSPKIVPKIVPFLCVNREDRRQDAEHKTDRPLSAIERLKSSFYLCVWNCHIQISNYTVLD